MDDDGASSPAKRQKSDDLFSFMPSNTKCTRKRHVSGNTSEVDTYLEEPCIEMIDYPLQCWKLNEKKVSPVGLFEQNVYGDS